MALTKATPGSFPRRLYDRLRSSVEPNEQPEKEPVEALHDGDITATEFARRLGLLPPGKTLRDVWTTDQADPLFRAFGGAEPPLKPGDPVMMLASSKKVDGNYWQRGCVALTGPMLTDDDEPVVWITWNGEVPRAREQNRAPKGEAWPMWLVARDLKATHEPTADTESS